jgi:hypothetical protein
MKGYIYKIGSPNTELYYIGSTTNVKNRFSVHLSIYKKYSDNSSKINSMSYKILKCGDPYIEILDEIEYENKEDLLTLERKYILEGGENTVNKSLRYRNKYYNSEKMRSYYLKNQEQRIQYQRDYRKRIKQQLVV